MKISQFELIHLDVPHTPHTHTHMQYWLPHWRISQLCKIALENGIIGWGETIPNSTWSKAPNDVAERVMGRNTVELLASGGRCRYHDDLGCTSRCRVDSVKTACNRVYEYLGIAVNHGSDFDSWAILSSAGWAWTGVKCGYVRC